VKTALVGTVVLGFFALPGVATADVVFDPADADELASVLAEATTAQDVCYGWEVVVDDAVAGRSESVGSNLGAGMRLSTAGCTQSVQFNAYITYTSESSESEDSASYDVVSTVGGPTKADLDGLNLDFDSLTGEDPDVIVGKAVAALPLLAADKGMTNPIEAQPETATAPADAQLTDDPDSDWWRNNGGALLWGVGLLLGGGVFAWWAFRTSRKAWRAPGGKRSTVQPYVVPDTVPAEFYEPEPTGPVLAPKPETASEPVVDTPRASDPAPEPPPKPATGTERVVDTSRASDPAPEPPPRPATGTEPVVDTPRASGPAPEPDTSVETESISDTPAPPSEKDSAPSDQKDKE
jgi:hypothetical protein